MYVTKYVRSFTLGALAEWSQKRGDVALDNVACWVLVVILVGDDSLGLDLGLVLIFVVLLVGRTLKISFSIHGYTPC